jgi:hypothetical protein
VYRHLPRQAKVPLNQEDEAELLRLLTAEVEQREDDIAEIREQLRELVQEMQECEANLLSNDFLGKSVSSFMELLGNEVHKFPYSILGDKVHGCHYQVSVS